MTTPTPDTKVTENLDAALLVFSNTALAQFNSARDTMTAPPLTDAAAQSKRIEKAQGELMGALTQLSAAAHMQTDQRNSAGYDAVVALMKTTADAADKISAKLVGVLRAEPNDAISDRPLSTDYQLIGALRDALNALAQLSPSAVWTAPSSSAKGS